MLECNICYCANVSTARRCSCAPSFMCDACTARVAPRCPFCRSPLCPPTRPWYAVLHAVTAAAAWGLVLRTSWIVGSLLRIQEWLLLMFSVDVVISYRRREKAWNTVVLRIAPETSNVIDAFAELD